MKRFWGRRRWFWGVLAVLGVAAPGTACSDGEESAGHVPHGPALGLDSAPAAAKVGGLTLKAAVHEVVPFGNYAFALNADKGVQVVDLTDATKPTALASLDTPGRVSVVEHDAERGMAYLVDSTGRLQIAGVMAADSP